MTEATERKSNSKEQLSADELAKLANNSKEIDGLSGTNVDVNTAMEAGQKFVGKGYKTTIENGMIKYTSRDGTKSFRMRNKKMKGVYEANFEMFDSAGNKLTNYYVGIIEN